MIFKRKYLFDFQFVMTKRHVCLVKKENKNKTKKKKHRGGRGARNLALNKDVGLIFLHFFRNMRLKKNKPLKGLIMAFLL